MAFGDVGGSVTELVITCRTPASGTVAMTRGDAVKLVGPYTVDNATDDEDVVFGQVLTDADQNDVAIPVKVRGICILAYTGSAPVVDGEHGVAASATDGSVKAPATGNGVGINVKVDEAASRVHVLL
ncbi:MAG: hypothetical protein GY851_07225 [bacterium]|nr:hypothetical protein [bacterium]